MGLAIALLTVSDTRSLADDSSGDALQQALLAAGHQLQERQLVPDDRYAIRAVLSAWIADPAVQVVISSGGTGMANGAIEKGHQRQRQRQRNHDGSRRRGNSCTKLQGRVSGFS